jgi:hypothetical protein
MADLVRTEQLKLVATAFNSIAVAVLTVGVFAPLAATLYGMGNPPQGLHLLAQWALSKL